jgi:hypothetical protein
VTEKEWESMSTCLKNIYDYRDAEYVSGIYVPKRDNHLHLMQRLRPNEALSAQGQQACSA